MQPKRFPYIPPDLLRELNRRYPERSAQKGDAIEDLWFNGGARSVVRFLNMVAEEQEKNKLVGDP